MIETAKTMLMSDRDALAARLTALLKREEAAERERTEEHAAAKAAFEAWDAPRRRLKEVEAANHQARRMATIERGELEAALRDLPASKALRDLADKVDSALGALNQQKEDTRFWRPKAERTVAITNACGVASLFIRDEARFLDEATEKARCQELIQAIDAARGIEDTPRPPDPQRLFVEERDQLSPQVSRT